MYSLCVVFLVIFCTMYYSLLLLPSKQYRKLSEGGLMCRKYQSSSASVSEMYSRGNFRAMKPVNTSII